VSVEINNLQQKFGEIKVQIIRGVTAPATMELVEDSITTDIPSIDKPSATKTNKSTIRPNTSTKQTESPEQTKPMEQPACSTERPAHVAGQSTNVTVTKAIADALDVFKSSLAPGIGISLRRIRLERTSKLFRQLEFRCNLQELSQVKMQLLMTQVHSQLHRTS
jgi:type III secretory pathway component EscV